MSDTVIDLDRHRAPSGRTGPSAVDIWRRVSPHQCRDELLMLDALFELRHAAQDAGLGKTVRAIDEAADHLMVALRDRTPVRPGPPDGTGRGD